MSEADAMTTRGLIVPPGGVVTVWRELGMLGRVFAHTVTIKKPVHTAIPGTKQIKIDYQIVATGVKCRIEPLSGRLRDSIIGLIPSATHHGFFLASQELKPNYMLVDANNKEYIVRDVQDPAGAGHHIEVILEFVGGGI